VLANVLCATPSESPDVEGIGEYPLDVPRVHGPSPLPCGEPKSLIDDGLADGTEAEAVVNTEMAHSM
jgi:hypothetical protein